MAADSNSKQNIPDLFKVIMEVDNEIDKLKRAGVISFEGFVELRTRRAELHRAAELALSWNHNKGNQG